MRLLALVMLLIGLLLAPAARALEPGKAFHHYVRDDWSIQQGLPQISVLSLTQDRMGYLWVGTQSGLARFDGIEFHTYTSENTPGLPGPWIRALYTGRDGRVWIGTYKGLSVFDGRAFKAVPAPGAAASLDITGLAGDAPGGLWVTSADGVFRLARDHLEPVAGAPKPAQSPLLRDDGLWVGARGAIWHRLPTGRWERIALPEVAADAQVNRLLAAQGSLWAATSRGLFHRVADGWVAYDEDATLARVPVDMLFEDRDANLWVGGDFGLARLRGGHVVEMLPVGGANGVPGLRTAFEDREGNLWLGSQWEGLVRVWSSWTRRYSTTEGLTDRIVWSLAKDPDGRGLWVGGNDGVSLLSDGHFRHVVAASDLPHPHAYNLLAESGRLWIGTRGGLRVLDAGEAKPKALPGLADIGGAQINAIVRARDGALWIGTPEGLFRWVDDHLRRFDERDGLTDARVRYVLDGPGGLVVGTQDGLFVQKGDGFVRDRDPGLPAAIDVTAIRRLADGRLVIGTLNETTFVKDGRGWHELGSAQGMPGNAPFFFTEDDGYLWSAGLRGISRVLLTDIADYATGRAPRVRGEMLLNERGDRLAGQQGFCCNGAGTSKGVLDGDTLWLPTRDGVVSMDTHGIRKNPVPPGVVIERVQLGNTWKDAWQLQSHPFPDHVRDATFEFTATSFVDPKSVQLRYRLRGYDPDWVDADTGVRRARYTNLPPGHYVFEVMGSNNAGVWAKAPATLAFSVPPRFHETGWFVALCVVGLALVVYIGYRVQRYRYQLRQKALEALVLQRTEALAQANRQLEEASHTDPLTGLRNRRYIGAQLPADLSFYDRSVHAGPVNDKAMLFALVDIDHFKQVNDRYGHRAGDLVLQQFAQVLSSLVRTGDYVARWGGEEFLLVFRPMPERNVATIGERIQQAVATHPFDLGNGLVLPITCSVGLSQYPIVREDGARIGWEAMIELADQALYYVKTNGRNGWASFRPTPLTDIRELVENMHANLSAMLARDALRIIGRIAGRPVGATLDEA
ncbi:GGDEF domain-containing protein [Lysobacter sp. TY2-98]|uniref:ligand-binding sensor domain-containing diguanylate cyclase n=1 Tax=Lysobacter sp. TY2-98 TaxID=2290922 RepID=UPI000E1FE759|nr:ligand-binding sensor domain-containing diguanylate cyclase [Lysobacter sp. TY2-98]AXK71365.1 GGDEF domain-containing protein [Lysobacter sp. TY2-98]